MTWETQLEKEGNGVASSLESPHPNSSAFPHVGDSGREREEVAAESDVALNPSVIRGNRLANPPPMTSIGSLRSSLSETEESDAPRSSNSERRKKVSEPHLIICPGSFIPEVPEEEEEKEDENKEASGFFPFTSNDSPAAFSENRFLTEMMKKIMDNTGDGADVSYEERITGGGNEGEVHNTSTARHTDSGSMQWSLNLTTAVESITSSIGELRGEEKIQKREQAMEEDENLQACEWGGAVPLEDGAFLISFAPRTASRVPILTTEEVDRGLQMYIKEGGVLRGNVEEILSRNFGIHAPHTLLPPLPPSFSFSSTGGSTTTEGNDEGLRRRLDIYFTLRPVTAEVIVKDARVQALERLRGMERREGREGTPASITAMGPSSSLISRSYDETPPRLPSGTRMPPMNWIALLTDLSKHINLVALPQSPRSIATSDSEEEAEEEEESEEVLHRSEVPVESAFTAVGAHDITATPKEHHMHGVPPTPEEHGEEKKGIRDLVSHEKVGEEERKSIVSNLSSNASVAYPPSPPPSFARSQKEEEDGKEKKRQPQSDNEKRRGENGKSGGVDASILWWDHEARKDWVKDTNIEQALYASLRQEDAQDGLASLGCSRGSMLVNIEAAEVAIAQAPSLPLEEGSRPVTASPRTRSPTPRAVDLKEEEEKEKPQESEEEEERGEDKYRRVSLAELMARHSGVLDAHLRLAREGLPRLSTSSKRLSGDGTVASEAVEKGRENDGPRKVSIHEEGGPTQGRKASAGEAPVHVFPPPSSSSFEERARVLLTSLFVQIGAVKHRRLHPTPSQMPNKSHTRTGSEELVLGLTIHDFERGLALYVKEKEAAVTHSMDAKRQRMPQHLAGGEDAKWNAPHRHQGVETEGRGGIAQEAESVGKGDGASKGQTSDSPSLGDASTSTIGPSNTPTSIHTGGRVGSSRYASYPTKENGNAFPGSSTTPPDKAQAMRWLPPSPFLMKVAQLIWEIGKLSVNAFSHPEIRQEDGKEKVSGKEQNEKVEEKEREGGKKKRAPPNEETLPPWYDESRDATGRTPAPESSAHRSEGGNPFRSPSSSSSASFSGPFSSSLPSRLREKVQAAWEQANGLPSSSSPFPPTSSSVSSWFPAPAGGGPRPTTETTGEPYLDWYQFRTIIMDELSSVEKCLEEMRTVQQRLQRTQHYSHPYRGSTLGNGNDHRNGNRTRFSIPERFLSYPLPMAPLEVPERPPVVCLTLAAMAPYDMEHFCGSDMVMYLRSTEVLKKLLRHMLAERTRQVEEGEREAHAKRMATSCTFPSTAPQPSGSYMSHGAGSSPFSASSEKHTSSVSASSLPPIQPTTPTPPHSTSYTSSRRKGVRGASRSSLSHVKSRYLEPPTMNETTLSIISRAKERKKLDEERRHCLPIKQAQMYIRAAIEVKPTSRSALEKCLDVALASEDDSDSIEDGQVESWNLYEREKYAGKNGPKGGPRKRAKRKISLGAQLASSVKRQAEMCARLSTPHFDLRWYQKLRRQVEEEEKSNALRRKSEEGFEDTKPQHETRSKLSKEKEEGWYHLAHAKKEERTSWTPPPSPSGPATGGAAPSRSPVGKREDATKDQDDENKKKRPSVDMQAMKLAGASHPSFSSLKETSSSLRVGSPSNRKGSGAGGGRRSKGVKTFPIGSFDPVSPHSVMSYSSVRTPSPASIHSNSVSSLQRAEPTSSLKDDEERKKKSECRMSRRKHEEDPSHDEDHHRRKETHPPRTSPPLERKHHSKHNKRGRAENGEWVGDIPYDAWRAHRLAMEAEKERRKAERKGGRSAAVDGSREELSPRGYPLAPHHERALFRPSPHAGPLVVHRSTTSSSPSSYCGTSGRRGGKRGASGAQSNADFCVLYSTVEAALAAVEAVKTRAASTAPSLSSSSSHSSGSSPRRKGKKKKSSRVPKGNRNRGSWKKRSDSAGARLFARPSSSLSSSAIAAERSHRHSAHSLPPSPQQQAYTTATAHRIAPTSSSPYASSNWKITPAYPATPLAMLREGSVHQKGQAGVPPSQARSKTSFDTFSEEQRGAEEGHAVSHGTQGQTLSVQAHSLLVSSSVYSYSASSSMHSTSSLPLPRASSARAHPSPSPLPTQPHAGQHHKGHPLPAVEGGAGKQRHASSSGRPPRYGVPLHQPSSESPPQSLMSSTSSLPHPTASEEPQVEDKENGQDKQKKKVVVAAEEKTVLPPTGRAAPTSDPVLPSRPAPPRGPRSAFRPTTASRRDPGTYTRPTTRPHRSPYDLARTHGSTKFEKEKVTNVRPSFSPPPSRSAGTRKKTRRSPSTKRATAAPLPLGGAAAAAPQPPRASSMKGKKSTLPSDPPSRRPPRPPPMRRSKDTLPPSQRPNTIHRTSTTNDTKMENIPRQPAAAGGGRRGRGRGRGGKREENIHEEKKETAATPKEMPSSADSSSPSPKAEHEKEKKSRMSVDSNYSFSFVSTSSISTVDLLPTVTSNTERKSEKENPLQKKKETANVTTMKRRPMVAQLIPQQCLSSSEYELLSTSSTVSSTEHDDTEKRKGKAEALEKDPQEKKPVVLDEVDGTSSVNPSTDTSAILSPPQSEEEHTAKTTSTGGPSRRRSSHRLTSISTAIISASSSSTPTAGGQDSTEMGVSSVSTSVEEEGSEKHHEVVKAAAQRGSPAQKGKQKYVYASVWGAPGKEEKNPTKRSRELPLSKRGTMIKVEKESQGGEGVTDSQEESSLCLDRGGSPEQPLTSFTSDRTGAEDSGGAEEDDVEANARKKMSILRTREGVRDVGRASYSSSMLQIAGVSADSMDLEGGGGASKPSSKPVGRDMSGDGKVKMNGTDQTKKDGKITQEEQEEKDPFARFLLSGSSADREGGVSLSNAIPGKEVGGQPSRTMSSSASSTDIHAKDPRSSVQHSKGTKGSSRRTTSSSQSESTSDSWEESFKYASGTPLAAGGGVPAARVLDVGNGDENRSSEQEEESHVQQNKIWKGASTLSSLGSATDHFGSKALSFSTSPSPQLPGVGLEEVERLIQSSTTNDSSHREDTSEAGVRRSEEKGSEVASPSVSTPLEQAVKSPRKKNQEKESASDEESCSSLRNPSSKLASQKEETLSLLARTQEKAADGSRPTRPPVSSPLSNIAIRQRTPMLVRNGSTSQKQVEILLPGASRRTSESTNRSSWSMRRTSGFGSVGEGHSTSSSNSGASSKDMRKGGGETTFKENGIVYPTRPPHATQGRKSSGSPFSSRDKERSRGSVSSPLGGGLGGASHHSMKGRLSIGTAGRGVEVKNSGAPPDSAGRPSVSSSSSLPSVQNMGLPGRPSISLDSVS